MMLLLMYVSNIFQDIVYDKSFKILDRYHTISIGDRQVIGRLRQPRSF